MSIIGIGTDIVRVARLEKLEERYGDRLASRLLGPAEWRGYQSIANHKGPAAAYLARRFAAKEAAAKALGCGIGARARLTELQVEHTSVGAPLLVFTGAARRRADALGVARSHLSISDEHDQALAFVILER
ncbi:holo-ACP synthase [Spiribacter vilamensis]|uniref:Holo-[acyl-carrier-protein] synthase n=1 Tax=Spiribacter vilamensis TaxID=531306 RepID=A0A4Q8CYZ8_9GAMM|nr:holo-ACP synthase [Spiribacter vilamensis]RZU98194.1 holo-[acyl-carrier protein] synthase [Spiribacter vilamensis]TVO60905.1 holo-ACP synthase [Spiribacter vilamensis]